MNPKSILGIHAPNNGYKPRLIENVMLNFCIITKAEPRMTPDARWSPIPPLVFLDAMAKPIIVRIMIVNGSALRLYNSVLNFLAVSIPRFSSSALMKLSQIRSGHHFHLIAIPEKSLWA